MSQPKRMGYPRFHYPVFLLPFLSFFFPPLSSLNCYLSWSKNLGTLCVRCSGKEDILYCVTYLLRYPSPHPRTRIDVSTMYGVTALPISPGSDYIRSRRLATLLYERRSLLAFSPRVSDLSQMHTMNVMRLKNCMHMFKKKNQKKKVASKQGVIVFLSASFSNGLAWPLSVRHPTRQAEMVETRLHG